jgi:hypothetical protein
VSRLPASLCRCLHAWAGDQYTACPMHRMLASGHRCVRGVRSAAVGGAGLSPYEVNTWTSSPVPMAPSGQPDPVPQHRGTTGRDRLRAGAQLGKVNLWVRSAPVIVVDTASQSITACGRRFGGGRPSGWRSAAQTRGNIAAGQCRGYQAVVDAAAAAGVKTCVYLSFRRRSVSKNVLVRRHGRGGHSGGCSPAPSCGSR